MKSKSKKNKIKKDSILKTQPINEEIRIIIKPEEDDRLSNFLNYNIYQKSSSSFQESLNSF